MLFWYKKSQNHTNIALVKEKTETIFGYAVFLALEIVLLYILFSHRTFENTNSPWIDMPSLFFVLYAAATILVIALPRITQNKLLAYASTIFHMCITFSVVIIVYPLGFGFDGFIHRATENWIQLNGFISPKQPVYIGQYSFIVWLSNLTAIPIFYIDVVLVPILSAVLIPTVVSRSLHKVWNIPLMHGLQLSWIIPVIYYVSLHLTTPHNVLILLTFVIVFGLLEYFSKTMHIIPVLLVSIAGLTIHALLGAPAFLCVVAGLLLRHSKKCKISVLVTYIFGMTFMFPILFSLYFFLTKQPLPNLTNPFNHIQKFLSLFDRPFWYAKQAPIGLEILYAWQRILPVFVCISAILAFLYIAKKKNLHESYLLFLFTFVGFFSGAFLLRSWIHFPNVGALEQGDYPLRLIKSSIIYLLPFLMYSVYLMVHWMLEHLKRLPLFTRQMSHYSGLFIIAVLLTASLYLAYPQQNAKAHFPGYNVSLSDFKAVRWINNNNDEYNYIVLANPLTSIAAMTEYGFPKYFETEDGLHSYLSVPTGAELYIQYQNMLYKGQHRSFMNTAMNYAGVKKSYFVVSSFWANFDNIIEGAQETADTWHIIDNGKIWIFTYYFVEE